ncbi:hypothetical protein FRC09_012066 [Ceratobasidium sp. 395]|nr:hypothetical protein FRC09_012066 [Ceratobasidium sp. 395]
MAHGGMKSFAQVPSRITWYYWTHLLRLLISLAWGLMYTIGVAVIWGYSPLALLYPMSYLLISINDILISTLDFYRTDSYFGTVLAQAVTSVFLLALPGTEETLIEKTTPVVGGSPITTNPVAGPIDSYAVANFVLNSIHIVCTLYLSISLLLSKREAGLNAPWNSNAKDVLLGSSLARSHPSWFGHPQNKLDDSSFTYVWAVYVPKILFRRVSLVESKRYAFFQNFCALLFIVAIIVRAVMALAQAQNQIETRSGIERCFNLRFVGNIQVSVRHYGASGEYGSPRTGQGYDVGVNVSAPSEPGSGQFVTDQCTSESRTAVHGSSSGNWFQVFHCRYTRNSYSFFTDATYSITIRSTNGTSLDAVRLPDIWFANSMDTFKDTSGLDQEDFMSSVVPWLVPPWRMVGAEHVDGSIDLVERRFITSSVFRDIIANLRPIYTSTSLFTIVRMRTTPSPDNFTSSALLKPSGIPSLSYLSNLADIMWNKRLLYQPYSCAFVEDYRSSTIFDALGSIGGLLAILQGVHILLFGRPMFWGLVGAKLISPFGLFRGCYSRGFRRRLRERYHRQPTSERTDDPAEMIRIHAFLRDFVIDFGPADVDDREGVELGRSGELQELYSRGDRDRSHGGDEYDTNNSTILLLLHPGADRHDSQGRATSADAMSSKWEP